MVESNQNALYMGMKLSTALLIKMDSVSKIIHFFFNGASLKQKIVNTFKTYSKENRKMLWSSVHHSPSTVTTSSQLCSSSHPGKLQSKGQLQKHRLSPGTISDAALDCKSGRNSKQSCDVLVCGK